MKSLQLVVLADRHRVTLYVRVWIEINGRTVSHVVDYVTLYVRVWIEIDRRDRIRNNFCVTLYVRVWIEIFV